MTKARIEGAMMEAVAVAAGFEKQNDGRWIRKDSEGCSELMVDYDPHNHDYDFVVVLWAEDDEYVEAMNLYAFLRLLSQKGWEVQKGNYKGKTEGHTSV